MTPLRRWLIPMLSIAATSPAHAVTHADVASLIERGTAVARTSAPPSGLLMGVSGGAPALLLREIHACIDDRNCTRYEYSVDDGAALANGAQHLLPVDDVAIGSHRLQADIVAVDPSAPPYSPRTRAKLEMRFERVAGIHTVIEIRFDTGGVVHAPTLTASATGDIQSLLPRAAQFLLAQGRPFDAAATSAQAAVSSSAPAADDPADAWLNDRANVVLGEQQLRAHQNEQAAQTLGKVRSPGPFASRALFALGMARAGDPRAALGPWTELIGRDPFDPAVQEGMLAVPYALAHLGAQEQSVEYAERAIVQLDAAQELLDRAATKANTDLIPLLDAYLDDVRDGWHQQLGALASQKRWWLGDPLEPNYYAGVLLDDPEFVVALEDYRTARQLLHFLDRFESAGLRADAVAACESLRTQLTARAAAVLTMRLRTTANALAEAHMWIARLRDRTQQQQVSTAADQSKRRDSWRWLSHIVVQTPSILPSAPASKAPPDLDDALAHYDRVIALGDNTPTRSEAMRRAAYLRVRKAEADPSTPDAQQALAHAIDLYRRVLAEAADDPANDRAHYQLARAYELIGDSASASTELATLARQFPDSPLAGDAHFRAGELYYLLKRYAAASDEYRAVVEHGAGAPYHRFATYKLGWSLYRQGRFEDALAPFLSLLLDVEPAASGLRAESLHPVSLAFTALGDDAIARYFSSHGGEPANVATLYLAVGAQQESMQRYSDAASTFSMYVAHHAGATGAPQWRQADVSTTPAAQLDDIAQSLHAQRLFSGAADAYRCWLEWFAKDGRAAEINLRYADALLDGGNLAEAARQYTRTAFDYPPNAKSSEAAFAAVQTYHALADRAIPARRASALRESIAASVKLADKFPQHAQWTQVLAAAASNEVELGEPDQAIALARRVLDSNKPMTAEVRARMFGVEGDGHFAASRFADAEQAYASLLAGIDARDPQRAAVTERLAASIYRQAQAARAAGDLRTAASGFQRVSRITPTASICATADYDAAAALIALQDWSAARAQLETFRTRYPDHALSVEADKKLAVADQNVHEPLKAAEAYARIAAAQSEPFAQRAEAALLSAKLFDDAGATARAAAAYQAYLATFPATPERRAELLQRLADISRDDRDAPAYRRYLDQIVAVDATGGTGRTHTLAAHATLEIGRMQADAARQIALSQPLARSLSRRKNATDAAIATFLKAADYHLADVTPAASYEVGRLYAEFADALVHSEPPRNLKGAALEQYALLLEEQSDPFDEKAIAAHESNLAHLRNNIWNDAIRGSAAQLSVLVPGRYAKREINEAADDNLR